MRLTGSTHTLEQGAIKVYTSWGGILGAILEFCQPQSASGFGFVLKKNFFVALHLHHQTAALVSKFSHFFNMGNSCLPRFVLFQQVIQCLSLFTCQTGIIIIILAYKVVSITLDEIHVLPLAQSLRHSKHSVTLCLQAYRGVFGVEES